jgi:hypothetical protein
MALNRADFRKQLQEGLNVVFGMAYKSYPEEWRGLFAVNSSRKAFEEDVLMAGFGAAPVKGEGSGVEYDEGAESYVARYNHETIALAFSITEEAEEDGLYGALGAKYAKALARSLQHTKEVKGSNILNNGFDSDFVGGDNVSLFATNHPLWGGGTQSNKLATPADISEASLEESLIQISDWVDERGIPIAVMAECLVIPTELQFIAERILASPYRSGTGDNDVNALKSMGMLPKGVKINHRLTDADAWFIITDCPDGLKHMVRKKVSRGIEGDFETGNMRYKARERYSFGWSDYRGGFGSEGADV